MTRIILAAFALALVSGTASSETLTVPGEYPTIQSAIDASTDGDTVLVAPGTYLENITFRTRNIVVTSTYMLTGDPGTILATIIDGSSPVSPDSASCVRIIGRQNSTAVLQGFTLTRGTGTKWRDEHGAGLYREGGGVLTARSSPIVKNNFLYDNEAVNSAGCVSAGGGAMRLGDGSPQVLNNVIVMNRAMYGAGIVLNYCAGAIVRNNVIYRNRVYKAVPGAPTYGGGGIWINNVLPGSSAPQILENNTVFGNASDGSGGGPGAGRGGGIHVNAAAVIARNNIIWANRQSLGGQINGSLPLTYSCIEGGAGGIGNIDAFPTFSDSGFTLMSSSPCIDAGDPDTAFNDPEDPGSPGNALLPAMGTIRNDMGAFGGPLAVRLPNIAFPGIHVPAGPHDFGLVLPGSSKELSIPSFSVGSSTLIIDSISFVRNDGQTLRTLSGLPILVTKGAPSLLSIEWSPAANLLLEDTVLIFHNDPLSENPARAALTGSSIPTPLLSMNTGEHNFGSIDVNLPSKDTTFFLFNVGTAGDSLAISLDPKNVNPPTAVDVSPESAVLAPGDSLAITFTFRPRDIIKTGLGLYVPVVRVDSRSTLSLLQKTMRFRLTGTVSVADQNSLPNEFALEQNYPNPFNPSTIIRFHLPDEFQHGVESPRIVRLVVYDALGREVRELIAGVKEPGSYTVEFDARELASGVYLYRLTAGSYVDAKRMVVVK